MYSRIKELRKELSLTQAEFGRRIGVKANTITNYETGLRNPSDAIVFAICREFDVNEVWLRTGEGEMFVEKTWEQEVVDFFSATLKGDDDFKRRVATVLARMTPEEWAAAQSIIKKFSENR